MNDHDGMGELDLAAVGSILAEPARARVLLALADGRSLAASVLAQEAGVVPSTASHHLARLVDAGFVTVTRRGRHRYFALAGARVAELIEAAAQVAPLQPVTSLRAGTRAHAIRYARRCYDHLAGRLGVAFTDAFLTSGLLTHSPSGAHQPPARRAEDFIVTKQGAAAFAELGVVVEPAETVRACLDWTEQRAHIAGRVGGAVMTRILELGWLTRDPKTRALRVTESGRRQIPERLGVELPAA
jgi:DNA-binding transcriptional ArsR family regulator